MAFDRKRTNFIILIFKVIPIQSCEQFSINYRNGRLKFQYEGENNKNGLINFMKDPREPPIKIKEPDWSESDSEVVHLSSDNFEPVLRDEASAIVMFYAPWCGHCKRMKPEFERAAAKLKMEDVIILSTDDSEDTIFC